MRKGTSMTNHADTRCGDGLRVVDGNHKVPAIATEAKEKTLSVYDATVFVGLRTVVYDAAIERIESDGEATIELPNLPELLASVAVARCLMPMRLRGNEMRAMRHIMKLTLADLAKRLGEKTAPETVSRWESETQVMGGYAEKVLRLLVCEDLYRNAPGIQYNASMIAHLNVRDPWRVNPNYEVPPVQLELVSLKEQCSGAINEAWTSKKAA
jgi:DNA-binding transcriptional regulator YiaG